MKKYSYYRLEIGQRVTLNESGIHDGKHIDKGTEFTIKGFPPQIWTGTKNKYFVFGITDNGNFVRVDLNQVTR